MTQRLEHRGTYPDDWSVISRRVRDEAGNRCIRCGHPHESPVRRVACDAQCRHPADGKQRVLTVHHADGDKSNVAWHNLLALCQVCHLQVQARLIPERPWLLEHSDWYKPYVAAFYAQHYAGLWITREEAEAQLDRWLALGQPWRTAMRGQMQDGAA